MHIFLSLQCHFHPILYEVKSCILFSTKMWAADNITTGESVFQSLKAIYQKQTPGREKMLTFKTSSFAPFVETTLPLLDWKTVVNHPGPAYREVRNLSGYDLF